MDPCGSNHQPGRHKHNQTPHKEAQYSFYSFLFAWSIAFVLAAIGIYYDTLVITALSCKATLGFLPCMRTTLFFWFQKLFAQFLWVVVQLEGIEYKYQCNYVNLTLKFLRIPIPHLHLYHHFIKI